MGAPPYHFEFPPKSPELREFFPVGDHFGVNSLLTMSQPDQYWNVGKNRRIEFAFAHAFGLLSMYAIKTMTDTLSTVPFLAASCIFMEEVTDFADIVLPDRAYLEEYQLYVGWLQQPVVQPLSDIPYIYDQFIEIGQDRRSLRQGRFERPDEFRPCFQRRESTGSE